jgi:hypothetical protein
MRSHLMKGVLLVVCVILVSVPLVAQKGKGGGGGNTGGSGGSTGGCALVTTPTVSTTTASPGINVGVFGRVTNCSTGKKRYTVEISSMSSCGMKTIIASSLITFNAGEAKLVSVSYPLAPNTCRGPMTVSSSVYSGGTMLATDSTALMVE